jgi:hypothetical protein
MHFSARAVCERGPDCGACSLIGHELFTELRHVRPRAQSRAVSRAGRSSDAEPEALDNAAIAA